MKGLEKIEFTNFLTIFDISLQVIDELTEILSDGIKALFFVGGKYNSFSF